MAERGTLKVSGDILYAWQEQEADGSWGIIGALVPGLVSERPLVMRDSVNAARLRPIAEQHARGTGRPVRLARFDLAEEQHLG